jgi:hypothetical protein
VLIPAGKEEGQGYATFLSTPGRPVRVRSLQSTDLDRAVHGLDEGQKQRFLTVVELIRARDSLERKRARERFEKWYEQKQKLSDAPDPNVTQVVARVFETTEAEAAHWFYHTGLVGKAKNDPRWLLSCELSDALREVRFVLWCSGRRFLPALYCPDFGKALYVRVLLSLLGGRGIGVCPYCGNLFVKKRVDQVFCSKSHRDIHRVVRWRARTSRRKKKEGSNGTRKAQ